MSKPTIEARCPNKDCQDYNKPQSEQQKNIWKYGKARTGAQRYWCRTCRRTFQEGSTCKPLERVFEPLTQKTLRYRSITDFSPVYLTQISIIQGVALGLLVSNIFESVTDPHLQKPWIGSFSYLFALLLRSLFSFILVIIVSIEYTWFVIVFRWPPNILDTVIPFILGISEVTPMFFLMDQPNWWLGTAFFCVIGAGGFLNTLLNCREYLFGENKQAYRRTRKALTWDIFIAVTEAAICMAGWNFSSAKIQVLCLSSSFALALILIWKEERFLKALYQDFGLTR